MTGIAWSITPITRACPRNWTSQELGAQTLQSSGVTVFIHPIMSHTSSQSPETRGASKGEKYDLGHSEANIRNFAPVARIMKTALPENAKIAKEAKECMQECVSEFISFITSEGMSRTDTQDRFCTILIIPSQLLRNVTKRSVRLSMEKIFSSP